MLEIGGDVRQSGGCGGWPKLGPWTVTSRIRQPRVARVPAKVRKEDRSHLDSSEPNSSSRPSSPQQPSSPGSPPDSDGWQKPSKVAKRQPPTARSGVEEPGRVDSGNSSPPSDSDFRALGMLGPGDDPMVQGPCEEAGPMDLVMLDQGQLKLKRARSPPGNAQPPSELSSLVQRSDRGKGPAARMPGTGRQQSPSIGKSSYELVLLLSSLVACGKPVIPGKEAGGGGKPVILGKEVGGGAHYGCLGASMARRPSMGSGSADLFGGKGNLGRILVPPPGSSCEMLAGREAEALEQGGQLGPEKRVLPTGIQHCSGEVLLGSDSDLVPEHYNLVVGGLEATVEGNRVAR